MGIKLSSSTEKYQSIKHYKIRVQRVLAMMKAKIDMLCLPAQPKKETTNLKTKNNQNCQKIELHGSLTTKELKKKQFIQTGRRGREIKRQGSGWWTGRSHIVCGQTRKSNWGARQTKQPRVPAWGK